jgi:hypothetical protein
MHDKKVCVMQIETNNRIYLCPSRDIQASASRDNITKKYKIAHYNNIYTLKM